MVDKTQNEITQETLDNESKIRNNKNSLIDSEISEYFKKFQKESGKYIDLDINEVDFEAEYPFEDLENIVLVGSKKIATHDALEKMHDKYGIPVYDASSNIKTYIDADKFPNETFEVKDNSNPDVSFASEGNSSAGTNFIIHQDKYFINNHRITMQFVTNKYFSKFIYLFIFNMKKKYGFKRGFTPSQTTLKSLKIKIKIPKQTKNYTSYQIQEAIVEFLEFNKEKSDTFRQNTKTIKKHIKQIEDLLLPSIFETTDEYMQEMFKKWNTNPSIKRAKKDMVDFGLEDIEFEIKRIHSDNEDDLICKKRMGFTPDRISDGDINWITVKDLNNNTSFMINEIDTKEKTTMELIKRKVDKHETGKSDKLTPIKKGDILVSFLLSVGIVKIYNSDLPTYCNQAIDILTINTDMNSKYIAYCCILEYPKYGKIQALGHNLNNDDKKLIEIKIPKPINNYTSYEIQKAIVSFIERFYEWKKDVIYSLKKTNKLIDQIDELFLQKTFEG